MLRMTQTLKTGVATIVFSAPTSVRQNDSDSDDDDYSSEEPSLFSGNWKSADASFTSAEQNRTGQSRMTSSSGSTAVGSAAAGSAAAGSASYGSRSDDGKASSSSSAPGSDFVQPSMTLRFPDAVECSRGTIVCNKLDSQPCSVSSSIDNDDGIYGNAYEPGRLHDSSPTGVLSDARDSDSDEDVSAISAESRSDSVSNLLEADDVEADLLNIKENHFASAEDFLSLTDIDRAIDKVKMTVLSLDTENPQRAQAVRHLVALRLRRDELQETASTGAALSDVAVNGSSRSVAGHAFRRYQSFPTIGGASERNCETCRALVWGVLQAWSGCAVCPVVCHDRCLGELRLACSGRAACLALPTVICPDAGLASQSYRCFDCRAPLAYGRQPEAEPRLCDVTGRYYCSECHWGDTSVVPARVLRNWDFEQRPVCRAAKHKLAALRRRWLVRPRDVNARLFNFVEELSVSQRLREEIIKMKAYFTTCSHARRDKLLLQLASRQHFVDDADSYTMRDLVDVARDVLLPELVTVHAAFTRHIKVECETCRGKGFLCELCDNRKDVLFPFDSGLASRCAVCGGVFHRVCFAKCNSPCPRCERRSRRMAGNAATAD